MDAEGRFKDGAVPAGLWTVELWRYGLMRMRRKAVAAGTTDLVIDTAR